MSDQYTYVILGAGRQGTAAAYDLIRWGEASKVVLADMDIKAANQAAVRVNQLSGVTKTEATQVDVRDLEALKNLLKDANGCLSAVPYFFNPGITRAAVESGVNMCDLGGNTDLARQQHGFNQQAKAAGISIVPNCGQVPGMGTTLCVHAIELLDEALDVFMWDGGLPQKPRPPFNFLLTYHIAGLTNLYAEPGVFLRNWKLTRVPPMTEPELVDFPQPIGPLEAFVTGGGTDTMPWTYEGKLRTLQNLTLRHPGHFAQLRAFFDLGLWDEETIRLGGIEVSPREVFHTLFEPKVTFPDDKDLVIVRVRANGKKDGREAVSFVELIDYYNQETGFTAMERCSGWSAAIVLEMAVKGQTLRGAGGVEVMVPSRPFVDALNLRGLKVTEKVSYK